MNTVCVLNDVSAMFAVGGVHCSNDFRCGDSLGCLWTASVRDSRGHSVEGWSLNTAVLVVQASAHQCHFHLGTAYITQLYRSLSCTDRSAVQITQLY